jgi:hypothetical protein
MKNVIALILATGLSACGAAKQANPHAVSYGVELMQCIERSATKEQSTACRREIDAKYGQCDGGCQ